MKTWTRRNIGRSTGRFERKYNRVWMRLRRADPIAYQAELARARERRRAKRSRKVNNACTRRWKKEHPERVRQLNRTFHREVRRRVCYACGHVGKAGRGGLKLIERIGHDARGREIPVKVLWCGKC